jgi:phytol kinase
VPVLLDRFLPDVATTIVVLPLTLLYASAAAAFAGWLRIRRGVRTPYTRKVFHFLILSAATLIHLVWGLPGTMVYGSTVVMIVLAAVLRGDGFAFYEALARTSDAPRRSLFIIVPLIATALGGVLANVFFPAWAYIGYAAVAWGDAVGEPVGTRWGRHRYRAPSIAGVSATRSLEGSSMVLLASAAACAFALIAAGIDTPAALGAAAIIGIVTMFVEAVSHHGADNLTIQLAAAGVAALLLG